MQTQGRDHCQGLGGSGCGNEVGMCWTYTHCIRATALAVMLALIMRAAVEELDLSLLCTCTRINDFLKVKDN